MSGRLRQRQLAILNTVLFCASAVPVDATTITVTNTNDKGPGSLRQALTTANDGDTINFAVTGTIILTSGDVGSVETQSQPLCVTPAPRPIL